VTGTLHASEAERAAAPPLTLGLALSLVSAAALAYEILLTRLFSITQWHHFAYMMISVALLGYGAAGSCVTVLRSRLERQLETVFTWSAALFGATAAVSFFIAQYVPFNALEFLWDWSQPFWLLVIYLLLLVPFFFAAVCVCLVFTRFVARAGRVYSFDILGAAGGCLGLVALLFAVPPLAALGWVSASALAAATLVSLSTRPRAPMAAAQFVLLGLALIWALSGPLGALRISPYKELSQTLQVMGTRTLAQTSSPLGLLTVVESPDVPFRYAPGLSLSAPSEPPAQLALFTDGEGLNAIVRYDGTRKPLAYLDYLTSAAGFHLPDGDPVRGHAAFVELRCHACHTVAGVTDLPRPVADPPLPFDLGGRSAIVRTDGELVTAILEPSHRVTMTSPASVQAGHLSRMGDFTEAMTVRQLIDLVAFVHAHTEVQTMAAAR